MDVSSLRAAGDFFVGVVFVGVLLVFAGIHAMGRMAVPEGANVVFQRPFVFEVGAADAKPELAAVLLVGPPVAAHGERLAALAAHEGLDAVLPLVMRLQGAEVFQWLRARVVNVVAASRSAAVARQAQHGRRLRSSERFRTLPVLRSVPPHVHLRPCTS